jgi:hypothetical protein
MNNKLDREIDSDQQSARCGAEGILQPSATTPALR